MPNLRVFKETALPGTLESNAIYFITPPGYPNHVEMYVTNTGATAPHRRVLNHADVQAMIDSAVSGLGGLAIVADIAARDALNPSSNAMVVVLDASADATVNSGSALYAYQASNTTWIKLAEYESMDVVVDWSNIQNRPASSTAAIDSAVANSHTHANLTQLNLIGQNGAGEMTYNGVQVKTEWASTEW